MVLLKKVEKVQKSLFKNKKLGGKSYEKISLCIFNMYIQMERKLNTQSL